MQPDNHILWKERDLATAKIPPEAKLFLMTEGLPEWIPYEIEFGLFDSDGEDLVIGVHTECPILIDALGQVKVETSGGPRLFNSSVAQLGDCIRAYLDLRSADAEENFNGPEELRHRLSAIDAHCWQPNSIWHDILQEIEKDQALL